MLSMDYLAGFIDAEGCISSYIDKRSTSSSSGCVIVTLSIVSTDKDIIQEISDTVCLITNTTPRKILSKVGPNSWDNYERKIQYTYKMRAEALRKILPILIPLLRLKKYQASTALELLRLTPTKAAGNNRAGIDRHLEERLELANKISWANQGYP